MIIFVTQLKNKLSWIHTMTFTKQSSSIVDCFQMKGFCSMIDDRVGFTLYALIG